MMIKIPKYNQLSSLFLYTLLSGSGGILRKIYGCVNEHLRSTRCFFLTDLFQVEAE